MNVHVTALLLAEQQEGGAGSHQIGQVAKQAAIRTKPHAYGHRKGLRETQRVANRSPGGGQSQARDAPGEQDRRPALLGDVFGVEQASRRRANRKASDFDTLVFQGCDLAANERVAHARILICEVSDFHQLDGALGRRPIRDFVTIARLQKKTRIPAIARARRAAALGTASSGTRQPPRCTVRANVPAIAVPAVPAVNPTAPIPGTL